MSIESEITRLVEAKQGLADWLTEQNVSVPNGALLGDLVALLDRVKTASTENAIVLKSTATISNGEIIVPGVAIDVRALDNLCAALAIQANTPNYRLCMTGSKAMVTNSSYTLNITDTLSCSRVADQCLYWCIDPDMTAFTSGEQFNVIAVWL